MKPLRDYLRIRRLMEQPMVRPFALAGPVLILLIALPLLRPLRHPDPSTMSNDETLRLATIRALVEHHSLQLDRGYAKTPGAVQLETGVYSSQPPMMALLLSVPAWVITHPLGYSFEDNQLLVAYLLTMLGVTLPVAATAGLIYRMSRLFELRRPWRTLLGFSVVACSGLLSYSVVLNPYAPAAALIIASAACLIHVAAMNRDDRRAGWFALAGACAALAATLDPVACVMLVLFIFVIPSMRFSMARRILGILLYILGAVPVVSMHAAWNYPVTGDIVPASLHPLLRTRPIATPVAPISAENDDEEQPVLPSIWNALGADLMWLLRATVGDHGLLSHFPVQILGILGIGAVMHRHWPLSTKTLAAVTAAGAIATLILYRVERVDWTGAMFASRWFLCFTPLLLFWAGAWVRRRHAVVSWVLAGLALAFSMGVGLLGATDPLPRHGFDRYTAAALFSELTMHPQPSDTGSIASRNP